MEIIRGSAKKPVSTDRLVKIFEQSFADEEGVLYAAYPVLSSPDDSVSIDALMVSREHGVVAINLIEGKDAAGFGEIQDEIAALLEAKFMQHKILRKGRYLLTPPETVTYAPLLSNDCDEDGHRLVNDNGIIDALKGFKWDDADLYEKVLSVIQSISTIRRNKRKRENLRPASHGAALRDLEDSIAHLDERQSKAVIETVEGVQRIRGLAGSGKTIVLALKAAYLHSLNPEWKIAVTFNTRSLKEQFTKLIDVFVMEQTGKRPNENIKIINAWGGPSAPSQSGIYYEFCLANGTMYCDYQQAKNLYGRHRAFAGATAAALGAVETPKPTYDAILIDEAQNFDPAFLRLCYQSLCEKKRLVYAYDELQSLTDVGLPAPEDIFGSDSSGRPLVTFDGAVSSQDIVLDKCYRNSRSVLAAAHALGFGIYRKKDEKSGTGLIQMFDRAELWTEVGYEVVDGALRDDHHVVLERANPASTAFLDRPGDVEALVDFRDFESESEQAEWVASQIIKNLEEDYLRAEDIVVINPNPIGTPKQVGSIRKILFEHGIRSHLAGVDTPSDVFLNQREGSITFAGIFRAKGNEAGMVYVINAQDCYNSSLELGKVRNRLFTAMTRSKAWVRVVGYGARMVDLKSEFQEIVDNKFRLKFVYPNQALRNRLRVVNRDMSADEKKCVRSARKQMSSLVQQLKAGDVQVDDLPDDELDALRMFLGQRP